MGKWLTGMYCIEPIFRHDWLFDMNRTTKEDNVDIAEKAKIDRPSFLSRALAFFNIDNFWWTPYWQTSGARLWRFSGKLFQETLWVTADFWKIFLDLSIRDHFIISVRNLGMTGSDLIVAQILVNNFLVIDLNITRADHVEDTSQVIFCSFSAFCLDRNDWIKLEMEKSIDFEETRYIKKLTRSLFYVKWRCKWPSFWAV